MNDAQFQEGLACGMCLYFQGTGTGLGLTPIPKQWQFGIVDNLCVVWLILLCLLALEGWSEDHTL